MKTFQRLPFHTPEEAIWLQERAIAQLEVVGVEDEDLIAQLTVTDCFKSKFRLLAELVQPQGQTLRGPENQCDTWCFCKRILQT